MQDECRYTDGTVLRDVMRWGEAETRRMGGRTRHGQSRRRPLCFWVAAVFIALLSSAHAEGERGLPRRTQVVGTAQYDGRWQYRWGDSPRDAHGALMWAQDPGDSGWHELQSLGTPPGRNGQRFLWMRTRLSGPAVYDPTLELDIVDQIFDAYLDGQLVMRFGQLDGDDARARRFAGYPMHLISLDDPRWGLGDYRGHTLTLRIYSAHINIGVFGRPRVGTRAELIRDAVRADVGQLIAGVVLAIFGLAALVLFLVQRSERGYLTYGGFSLFTGVWILCQLKTRMLVWASPLWWTHIELFSLYTNVMCLIFFLARTFGDGPLGLMPRLAWLFLIYEVAAAVGVATGAVTLLGTLLPFQLIMLLGIVYTLTTVGLSLRSGRLEAKLFAIGFVSAALFSGHDLLAAMGVLSRTRISIGHLGHVTFVLSLGLILAGRFRRVYRELVATKRDLSDKLAALGARNTEIELLNTELRHQIEARSRSLIDSLLERSGSSQEAVPILAADTVINRRYRVLRVLGQGAMGVVYEVERQGDGRHFAAKVLSGRAGRQQLARFAREAQLLARLSHPNLVTISDVDVADHKVAYIVMQMVTGGTLAARSARFGQTDFALPILRQIASALSAVHAAGIVHRDLKPANILLEAGEPPVVKLGDFGVSALLDDDAGGVDVDGPAQPMQMDLSTYNVTVDSTNPPASAEPGVRPGSAPGGTLQGTLDGLSDPVRRDAGLGRRDGLKESTAPTMDVPADGAQGRGLTQTGVIMGTPLYMAPELVRGAKLARPPSDIFSFGVIAYELLTGFLPSEQPPIVMGLKPHVRWYVPLAIRCPDLPEHIGSILERCLDAAPEERPTAVVLQSVL